MEYPQLSMVVDQVQTMIEQLEVLYAYLFTLLEKQSLDDAEVVLQNASMSCE